MKQNQRGFTIIELVFVIAIIGILAAFAVPRFVDLQSDARAANIRALSGAVRAASAMVHGKAIVEQKEKSATSSVEVEGAGAIGTVNIVYGYPAASAGGIGAAVDFDGNYQLNPVAGTPAVYTVRYVNNAGTPIHATGCQFVYTEPGAAGEAPEYALDTSGC